MSAPVERRIDDLDVPLVDVLEQLRQSLPVFDPDRHALDTVADDAFAHLVPGYPVDPDFAASAALGFVPPVDWDGPVPASSRRPVVDIPLAGGAS